MRLQFSVALIGALLFSSSPRIETADFQRPAVGSFGFDWLKPEEARCTRITPSHLQRFTHCDFHESGAFGLNIAYHACQANGEGEYLVFGTAAACIEALETMQANAP